MEEIGKKRGERMVIDVTGIEEMEDGERMDGMRKEMLGEEATTEKGTGIYVAEIILEQQSQNLPRNLF